MIALMRNVCVVFTLLMVLACSAPAPAQQGGAAPGEVAARVGDRTITVQEVDERWQRAQPAARAQAIQQLYDGRKEALDGIINDMLIEQAAKAQGVPPDQ